MIRPAYRRKRRMKIVYEEQMEKLRAALLKAAEHITNNIQPTAEECRALAEVAKAFMDTFR